MPSSLRNLSLLLLCWSAVLIAAPLELQGPLEQGAVVFGRAMPGARVFQDGEPVPVSPEGDFVIGFGREAPERSKLEVVLPGGKRIQRELKVAKRQYRIQRIDGLPPSKVTPRSKKTLERIRREVALVKKARARRDRRTDFLRGFQWPATGPITGVYGSQRILNGKPRRPHYGVDIAGPVGTPVRAPADGIVTLAEPDLFYSGGTLIIDHGHGLSSTLMHLSRILVKVGDHVKKGEVVAEMGATGRATGSHLDWRMNLRGRRVDPQTVVGPMQKDQEKRQ